MGFSLKSVSKAVTNVAKIVAAPIVTPFAASLDAVGARSAASNLIDATAGKNSKLGQAEKKVANAGGWAIDAGALILGGAALASGAPAAGAAGSTGTGATAVGATATHGGFLSTLGGFVTGAGRTIAGAFTKAPAQGSIAAAAVESVTGKAGPTGSRASSFGGAFQSALGQGEAAVSEAAQKTIRGYGAKAAGAIQAAVSPAGPSVNIDASQAPNPLQAGMAGDLGAMTIPLLVFGAIVLLTGKKH